MYIGIIVIIIIAVVLLVLVVLAQNPKGGMAANFGLTNQVMGARQSSDLLEKVTWITALVMLVLCFTATAFMSETTKVGEAPSSELRENLSRPMDIPQDEESLPVTRTTEEATSTSDSSK